VTTGTVVEQIDSKLLNKSNTTGDEMLEQHGVNSNVESPKFEPK
jgi:hypothetical protein